MWLPFTNDGWKNNQSNRFSALSLGAAPRCSSQRTTSNSSRSSTKSQEGIPGISLRKLATLGISPSSARTPQMICSGHLHTFYSWWEDCVVHQVLRAFPFKIFAYSKEWPVHVSIWPPTLPAVRQPPATRLLAHKGIPQANREFIHLGYIFWQRQISTPRQGQVGRTSRMVRRCRMQAESLCLRSCRPSILETSAGRKEKASTCTQIGKLFEAVTFSTTPQQIENIEGRAF